MTSIEDTNLSLFIGLNVFRDDNSNLCQVWKVGGELVFNDPLPVLLCLDGVVTITGKPLFNILTESICGPWCDSVDHTRRELDIFTNPCGEFVLICVIEVCEKLCLEG